MRLKASKEEQEERHRSGGVSASNPISEQTQEVIK